MYSASTRYKCLLFTLSPPDTDTLRARDKYTSQILFRVNLTEIYLPSVTSRGDLYASGCRIARQVIVEAASCQPHPHPQYGYVRCLAICMGKMDILGGGVRVEN